jgi:hypothetical protein
MLTRIRVLNDLKKRFGLLNVVRANDKVERDIEDRFGRHITTSDRRKFVRMTWEAAYDPRHSDPETARLIQFFQQKNGWLLPMHATGPRLRQSQMGIRRFALSQQRHSHSRFTGIMVFDRRVQEAPCLSSKRQPG